MHLTTAIHCHKLESSRERIVLSQAWSINRCRQRFFVVGVLCIRSVGGCDATAKSRQSIGMLPAASIDAFWWVSYSSFHFQFQSFALAKQQRDVRTDSTDGDLFSELLRLSDHRTMQFTAAIIVMMAYSSLGRAGVRSLLDFEWKRKDNYFEFRTTLLWLNAWPFQIPIFDCVNSAKPNRCEPFISVSFHLLFAILSNSCSGTQTKVESTRNQYRIQYLRYPVLRMVSLCHSIAHSAPIMSTAITNWLSPFDHTSARAAPRTRFVQSHNENYKTNHSLAYEHMDPQPLQSALCSIMLQHVSRTFVYIFVLWKNIFHLIKATQRTA